MIHGEQDRKNPTMMDEIRKLEKQITLLDEKTSSVLSILRGNEFDKHDVGMLGIQRDHEKRIISLEKLRDRAMWFALGLGVPAGWGIIDIIQKIIAK